MLLDFSSTLSPFHMINLIGPVKCVSLSWCAHCSLFKCETLMRFACLFHWITWFFISLSCILSWLNLGRVHHLVCVCFTVWYLALISFSYAYVQRIYLCFTQFHSFLRILDHVLSICVWCTVLVSLKDKSAGVAKLKYFFCHTLSWPTCIYMWHDS